MVIYWTARDPSQKNKRYQEVGGGLQDTCIIVTSKLNITYQRIQVETSSVRGIVKLLLSPILLYWRYVIVRIWKRQNMN